MSKKIVIISTVALFLISSLAVFADPAESNRKIYHNEKEDLLVLYPYDWSFIENFGDNIPVIFHPPKDEEPDGFIMVYFAGEGVVKDLDELLKVYKDDALAEYDSYEIISQEKAKTKEGFDAIDLKYNFVDHGEKLVSDTRLTITDDDFAWGIFFDRPSDAPESVVNEAMEVVNSVIFSAAEYLTLQEN